jgi:uncharacterized protein YaaN involved in tellurite resistance
MRKSPFDKSSDAPATTQQPFPSFTPSEPATNPVVPVAPAPMAHPSSVFENRPKSVIPALPYTADDIDHIGKDSEARLSQISERVTKKMTLNRMGDVGVMLADAQREMGNLDPANLLKPDGLFGRLRQHFLDIGKELSMRFQTADGALSKLRQGMNDHVARLAEWEKDDAEMYAQNYERFKDVLKSLAQVDGIIAQLQAAQKAWPVVDASDPEAMMKAQQKFVLEDLITRAKARRESILRAKLKCELNAPEILAMKSASGKLIAKFNSAVNDVLPEILREIAQEIQRLNTKEASSALRSFGTFANTMFQKGAQSTKETVLEANKLFNEATISVETITSMQNSVRDMVIGIQSISVEAEKRRIAEEATINANQASLLNDLQKHGAV